MSELKKTRYLLYGGSSVDGCGTGEYIGRTLDKEEAEKHAKNCNENPYSTGHVDAYNDEKEWRLK